MSDLTRSDSLTESVKLEEGPSRAENSSLEPSTAVKFRVPEAKQDEGIVAWLQCWGGFCIFFATWGMIGSYGAFQSYYQTHLLPDSSPSSISWIGSLQGALMLFGSALVGPLYERGHFKLLLRVGSLLSVMRSMLTSVSTEYWHLILTQGFLTGLGLALVFLPTVALLPTWFVRHRALAISLASAGTGMGGILIPIVFNKLWPRVGFSWTIRILGFIYLILFLMANAVLSPRSMPPRPRRWFAAAAWCNGPYVLVAVTSLLGYLGVYIPFFYMQVYATSTASVSNGVVPYLLPLMNVGYSIGRVVPGLLADHVGASNTLTPCLLASGVLAICWAAIRSEAGLIVFCLLFGFISAPLGSLGPATIVAVTPDLSEVGVYLGMIFPVLGIGLLIGAPIGGALLEEHGWLGVQVFCGVALISSAICLAWSRVWKTGWVLKAKH